ncbi:MAG: hypothetical protein CL402_09280 [Acidiferrobacteraceae bacterium]|mgnify:CR=1 FL=1|nr:hypothetical protein [Acidiferrobacteraceae bacterium]|tara:strand:- start:17193 stop:17786 length:594 start_codon:yes stop_codon:yes gene_type:complete
MNESSLFESASSSVISMWDTVAGWFVYLSGSMTDLNILDLIVIIILTGSLLLGIIRGLIREILGLIAWVVSFWLGWKYGTSVGDYLVVWVKSEQISNYLGLGLVFLASLFALTIVSKVLHSQFRVSGLTVMNRLLGAVFGLARGLVFATLLLFVAQLTPAMDTKWYRKSELVPYLNPILLIFEKTIQQKPWTKDSKV